MFVSPHIRRLSPLVAVALLGSLGGCAPPPKRALTPKEEAASGDFRQGLKLREAGKPEAALSAFLKARGNAPSVHVDLEIARTLDRLQRRPLACRVWRHLATQAPIDTEIAARRLSKEAGGEVEGRHATCWKNGLGLPFPATGARHPEVTIVEFTDVQCPYCARAAKTMARLLEEYEGRVRLVVIHNPLPFHRQAFDAARFAVAAQLQGRFFPALKALFEQRDTVRARDWAAIAETAGVDWPRAKAAMDDPALSAVVKQHMDIAAKLGAQGTPTFYINGEKLPGAQPLARFKAAVDRALADQTRAKAKGLSTLEAYEQRVNAQNPTLYQLFIQGMLPDAVDAAETPKTPTRTPAKTHTAPSDTVWKVPVGPNDAILGPKNALVTVVEFTDLQCPFCARAAKTMEALQTKYPQEVRLVFKHNPLPFHKDARGAAKAALAAQAQGRFWPMAARLFADQRHLDRAGLMAQADAIGLDLGRFRHALDDKDGAFDAHIAADQALARRLGALGTPTFYINGVVLRGAQPLARFVAAVDRALARAKAQLASGTPRDRVYEVLMAKGVVKQPFDETVHSFKEAGRIQFGPKDAAVTITAFTDYQCPFCKRFDPRIRAAVQQLEGKVRVVIKNFPLAFHKDALPAARAALAATRQGKGPAMHRLLFEAKDLKESTIEALAQKAGVNKKRYHKALSGDSIERLLREDRADADKAGVRGTPTFFFNGRRLKNHGLSTAAFVALIREHFLKR